MWTVLILQAESAYILTALLVYILKIYYQHLLARGVDAGDNCRSRRDPIFRPAALIV